MDSRVHLAKKDLLGFPARWAVLDRADRRDHREEQDHRVLTECRASRALKDCRDCLDCQASCHHTFVTGSIRHFKDCQETQAKDCPALPATQDRKENQAKADYQECPDRMDCRDGREHRDCVG